ncbi:MAG: MBL fold metallo-hydrolase, partial [Acidobacteriaceae bacterium]|nr:MBL fold metallo-hydrolase [Acidobacteriaceae bacterium]
SLFLAFPNGQTLLVDAGGFPGMERMARKPQIDMGEDVVSPYLWSRGIKHLDFVALSHGHSDHMAGLPAVLDNFHPGELWIGAEPETNEWDNVKRHAQADGVRVVSLTRASPRIAIGATTIRVLAPSPDYVPGAAPENNDSLVMEISYGKRSILLTGDAERPVEDDMVSNGMLRPVTLLKVGHHGSKTSSSEEFVQAIQPKYAVISDGYMNQFHHPHPAVLERFEQHGVKVFRTDQEGATTFRTDGERIEFETYR